MNDDDMSVNDYIELLNKLHDGDDISTDDELILFQRLVDSKLILELALEHQRRALVLFYNIGIIRDDAGVLERLL